MWQSFHSRKHLLASACFGLALVVPCAAQAPIGNVVAGDASVQGSVVVVSGSTTVLSGSSITAGSNAASLRLTRGGEVLVCPRSRLSLTNSQSGRDLVFAMDTGAMETHFALGTAADTILTPDFRILLAGPAAFHFAIGSDARGNTCVRSLQGNTASIIISEIMGDGVYQVRPGEQAYFRNGSVANVSQNVPPDCGCPMPVPITVANRAPAALPIPSQTEPVLFPRPETLAESQATSQVQAAQPASKSIEVPANSPEALIAKYGTPTSTPLPPTSPDNEIHVLVDAPFVFRGGEDDVPPPPTFVRMRLEPMPGPLMASLEALPPVKPELDTRSRSAKKGGGASSKPARKGFFGRVRSFFAAIFK
ncbi:MAG TPA: hypothetical protein VD837_16130 [Terriglobales bacterium]|nr:hypothetical protein [Terriglobales bacterium]